MTVVCPYCVQWRCATCKSEDWPQCCDEAQIIGAESYWPDGSVAELTQHTPCEHHASVLADYEVHKEPG